MPAAGADANLSNAGSTTSQPVVAPDLVFVGMSFMSALRNAGETLYFASSGVSSSNTP